MTPKYSKGKFDTIFNHPAFSEELKMVVNHELKGDRLVIRVLHVMHKRQLGFLPPSSLTDLFKDINQGAEVNLRLGTSPAHILKDDENLLSHLLMGFKGSVKVSYAT